MIVCLPVTEEGQIDPRWGRADRVAVVALVDGGVSSWEEVQVGWGRSHDQAGEGSHHAGIARFLMEHQVQVVVASHMGPPMENMLAKMGIRVLLRASGDARQAVSNLASTWNP